MRLKSLTFLLLAVIISLSSVAQSAKKGVAFVNKEAEKKVDIMIDGKLFTSYCWPDNVMKPILFPIQTPAGTIITRGYPLNSRPGETVDHPHHNGCWLNYGDVNGYNFWGNLGIDRADTSAAGKKRNSMLGSIKHLKFEKLTGGATEGTMIANESWIIDVSNKELLKERTEYHFIAKGKVWIIDRITTLTANDVPVTMNDTKEGMYGIRVARQLELPSKAAVILTGADGKSTGKKDTSNEGVTGNYRSSEGVTGEAVWSTRARWMDLYGNIGNEKISIIMCDHPKNQSYPTYWHARGYGLFCLNPFGAKDFTSGKEVLNFTIPAGKSTTLRYRIVVNSGSHLTDAEINAFADDFAKKY
jgi:hypothetical protein